MGHVLAPPLIVQRGKGALSRPALALPLATIAYASNGSEPT